MNDDLGNRMKSQYEDRTRFFLPRRTYTIIRLDGKAFHTLTRGCSKPFDRNFIQAMDYTAQQLCKEIQGVAFAYVQSDEISLLLTDFENPKTEAWFDGNVQKMASVSAAMATRAFNTMIESLKRLAQVSPELETVLKPTATFDARVFTIPDPIEVENYFIWRQQDASRNSVQMVARSLYSHSECHGKNNSELQEMIHAAGQNWNDYPAGQKRGRVVRDVIAMGDYPETDEIFKKKWIIDEPPIFTQDRSFFKVYIPLLPVFKEESNEEE